MNKPLMVAKIKKYILEKENKIKIEEIIIPNNDKTIIFFEPKRSLKYPPIIAPITAEIFIKIDN